MPPEIPETVTLELARVMAQEFTATLRLGLRHRLVRIAGSIVAEIAKLDPPPILMTDKIAHITGEIIQAARFQSNAQC